MTSNVPIGAIWDDSTPYERLVKWLRRLTALATNAYVISWIVTGASPTRDILGWLSTNVSQAIGISAARLLVALLVGWYLFLSQLKPRWILFLPLYVIFWPSWRLGATLFNLTVTPTLRRLGMFGHSLATPPANTSERGRLGTLLRTLWLLLFLVWAIVPSGSRFSWTAWILPLLWLPFWWYLLRLALRAAVFPRAFVSVVTKAANGLLDHQMNAFRKAVTEQKRPSSGASFYLAITGLLSRYSDHRLVAIVQREALLYFSVVLVGALAASSVLWGLVGYAILRTAPQALAPYDFFTSGTLTEAVLWAWGCMTTTVNFPGTGAALSLKVIHSAILGTGLFQLTFLISSFAVLTPAEAPLNASEALIALQFTRKKVEIVQDLEKTLLKNSSVGPRPDSA